MPSYPNTARLQRAKYPHHMYRPALRVLILKQGDPAEDDVFLAEGSDTEQALIEKYLTAYQRLFPLAVAVAGAFHFQFGRAVAGTEEMRAESFLPE